MFSRIDGRTSDHELALATGMSRGDIVLVLHRLAELGAVDYDGAGENRSTSGSPPRQEPRSDPNAANGAERARAEPRRPLSIDPQVLESPADLDPDRKRTILETFQGLDDLSYYELLGVDRKAEKKAIKRAYYDVVAVFHPDKYFGKNLGIFRAKLDRIFQRVTEAHDALTRSESRAEYDRYLESRSETRAFDGIADDQATAKQVAEIHRDIEREALLAEQAAVSSRPPAGPLATHGVSSTNPPRPLTPDERRRALARKLSGSGIPAPLHAASDARSSFPAAAVDDIKRRYERRLVEVRTDRVQAYVDQAEAALAAKNLVGATNALRLAVSLAPDDTALAERFRAVEQDASAAMAGRYEEQARYDERRGHFQEAAVAFERALRGKPSAATYERAAHCLVEARLDMKKAADFARKAVEQSPSNAAYRITLARVYAGAGMEQSALGELERARTLAPSDDTIKDWIKRVKRGEI